MSTYLSDEKKREIFTEFGGDAANTGSIEAQVALFTYRIKSLSEHLKSNKKDNSCKRTMLTLVGKRKRLLKYLMHRDIQKYRDLIEKLGIRK
ncbi:MAG: 30S ribosomal protein S15 [Saprospiraceae bacterium]|nr:30S ribosomal protein S15 [Saprospiraceae bacterium]MCB9309336.1 30S ribosomal protein S15 [Lewinellaceae bacterium]